jgi:hypothetical protein
MQKDEVNGGKFNGRGCVILSGMKFWIWILFLIVGFLPACAQENTIAPPSRLVCELKDSRIDESSGLAASREYSAHSLLVTHNDSGGKPEIFYINLQGETVAGVLLRGAQNLDWEDIAISGGWIYVSDSGDNLRRRKNIVIYRLREPRFDPEKINQSLEADCEKMTLQFPDGAHDCETLMATKNGELVFVSKLTFPFQVGDANGFYKTPAPFQNGKTQTLQKIGEYAFAGPTMFSYLTTGGDLSPDESRFVVRTYTDAYEWKLPADNDWKNVAWSTPSAKWELPQTQQGEAICYSADGKKYYISSEKLPTPIWEIAPMQ